MNQERVNNAFIKSFGEPVILDSGDVVRGIFGYPTERAGLNRDGQDGRRPGIVVPARDPVLSLLETDAVTIERGSTVVVRGKKFDVIDPLPTGDGMVNLLLSDSQEGDPAGATTWR